MTTYRVVTLRGEPAINEEYAAAAAITPGHLVDFNGSSQLVKHAGQALNASKMFALERDEMGNGVSDDYAAGDRVKVGTFKAGDIVAAFIASGVSVVDGDYLESKGDGTLQLLAEDATRDDDQIITIVGRAREVYNNTAGPVAVRIRVEVV